MQDAGYGMIHKIQREDSMNSRVSCILHRPFICNC